MISKYHIEFTVKFGKHEQLNHYQTDDPIAAQDFLVELLERGFSIATIKHEGLPLGRHEFDRMIKTAAGILAARRIRASLHLTAEEEHFRFGFAS